MSSEQDIVDVLIEEIRLQLTDAQIHLDILETLGHRPEELSGISYVGFFSPTSSAHALAFIVRLSNVFDRHGSSPSFYRLLRLLKGRNESNDVIDVGPIRAELGRQEDLMSKVRTYRNQRAAHINMDKVPDEIQIDEARSLLLTLQWIFNEIYMSMHPGETWAFETVQSGDSEQALNAILWHHRVRTSATIAAYSAVRESVGDERYYVAAKYMEPFIKAIKESR